MIDKLQILVQILTPLTTRALLPLTSVSHRFHSIVLRILHYRLLLVSSLKEYKLLLECFHPVSKLTDPHFFCTYLGTPGLSDKYEGKESLYEDCEASERLGRLSSVYSCFRPEVNPHVPEDDDWQPRNAIDPNSTARVVGEDDESLNSNPREGESLENDGFPQLVKKQVNLEEFEDFSQLCAVVNLVKLAPNSALLISAVTVEDGVIRIWRDWLRRRSKKRDSNNNGIHEDADKIVWVGNNKNVGLKLRVKEKKWNRQVLPILMHRDEDVAVNYEVEIEGKLVEQTLG